MSPHEDQTGYLFAGYRLDPRRGMLLDPAGAEVRLRPKPFALLRYLLDRPGLLLGREALFEALWPGVAVTDDSLTQCISELRRAFGDQAAAILRTAPRRGYMLVAAVRRVPSELAEPAPAGPAVAARGAEAPSRGSVQELALVRRDTLHVLPVAFQPGNEAGRGHGAGLWLLPGHRTRPLRGSAGRRGAGGGVPNVASCFTSTCTRQGPRSMPPCGWRTRPPGPSFGRIGSDGPLWRAHRHRVPWHRSRARSTCRSGARACAGHDRSRRTR
jgi:DNA-binding winged helix-turn-helix (wHTH) protein